MLALNYKKRGRIWQNGFTLVELLVTMTLVAVVVGISIPSLVGSRKASRDSLRKADVEQIRAALEFYRNDCRTYPADEDFVIGNNLQGKSGVVNCENVVYLEKIPFDPLNTVGRVYYYHQTGVDSYVLCARLENKDDTLADGCGVCGDGNCNYSTKNP